MCEGQQPTPEEIEELWGDPGQQSNSTLLAESVTASPAKLSPGASPARPRRRTLLKKMQSAPDLSCPKSPSVWGIVQAVQKIQQDDLSSQYSKKEEKFEVPEYKISVPLTPDAGTKKKLNINAPLSTGRISERLPQMNQVPAIFDICSTSKSKVEGDCATTISKAERDRILEILTPPMDDDLISAISGSTRKSRATTRSSKDGSKSGRSSSNKSLRSSKRSSSNKSKRSSSKKRSSKLKKASSAPDLFGEEVYKRSTSDRTLFGEGKEESNEEDTNDDKKKKTRSSSRKSLKKSKSDPSLVLSPRKSSRRSSSKKLKKLLESDLAITKRRSSKSPAKKMKKSNSCPSLTDGDKKKKKSKKVKRASLNIDLAVGGKKKKDRKPRRKSTSMLDDDSTFCAEAESLKAEVEERIRMAKQKLQDAREDAPPPPPASPAVMETPPASNLRKSGAHEEERIRVFAESMRRSASLSPSRFKLGDIDGFRMVESNDRRFGKSWSKVMPTPPTTPKKAIEWTRPKNIPPPIPVSDL